MSPAEELTYGLLGLALLLIPSLAARGRKHPNTNPIFLLTIGGAGAALFVPLVGFLLWLGAFIWAFTGKKTG